MDRLQPPILPYKAPPPATGSRVQPMPLTFDNISQLDAYLPPPRDTFLPENGDSKEFDKNRMGLPHVTLTYAQSIDAQISLQPGIQTILSGPESKAMTHYLRSRHDAILVGVGTAKADNPGLNTRYSPDGRRAVPLHLQPRPFILDPGCALKLDDISKLLDLAENAEGRAPWWITATEHLSTKDELASKIQQVGGGIVDAGNYVKMEQGVDWELVLTNMAEKGITSVMIEGGSAVIKDLLQRKNQKYISSVIVTIAPTYLGAGVVGIAPTRTTQAANEVNFRYPVWVPMGQDIVMAALIFKPLSY